MPLKNNPRPLLIDLDDKKGLKERIIEAVTGTDGYWPKRVEDALTKAGFGVRYLLREEYHPTVWKALLTRGALDLPNDNQAASKQIRRALAQQGIRIAAGELTVTGQRRDTINIVFMFGSPMPPVDV